MDWITKQLDRAVEIRKDYLRVKSIRSILANEPKFLWIHALGRLKSREEATSKYKFNTEMEEMLSCKTGHYVMDVQQALSNITDFTQMGNLSGIGKICFWNEINRQLQLFEFKAWNCVQYPRRKRSCSGMTGEEGQIHTIPHFFDPDPDPNQEAGLDQCHDQQLVSITNHHAINDIGIHIRTHLTKADHTRGTALLTGEVQDTDFGTRTGTDTIDIKSFSCYNLMVSFTIYYCQFLVG